MNWRSLRVNGSLRQLGWNTVGLYLDTAASYVFSIIAIPYLVRVLGPVGFGLVAFAQSFVAYFTTFVDYASLLGGTRLAAAQRHDPLRLSVLAWNSVFARLLLAVLALPLIFLLAFFIPSIRDAAPIVAALSGILLAQALSPTWIFQGLERMPVLALINLTINVAAIVAILLLVRGPEDVLTCAFLFAAAPLAASVVGLAWLMITTPLHFARPRPREILQLLRGGFTLSLSTAAVTAYTTGNAFLLGLLADKETVAYYAAAEKLVRLVVRGIGPITQALFPRMVRAAAASEDALFRRAGVAWAAFVGIGGAAALFLWIAAPILVRVLLGEDFARSTTVLRVLTLLPPLIVTSNVLGIQLLIPLHMDRAFAMSVASAGLVNVAAALLLVPTFGEQGMALSVVSAEAFAVVALAYYLRSRFPSLRPRSHATRDAR